MPTSEVISMFNNSDLVFDKAAFDMYSHEYNDSKSHINDFKFHLLLKLCLENNIDMLSYSLKYVEELIRDKFKYEILGDVDSANKDLYTKSKGLDLF